MNKPQSALIFGEVLYDYFEEDFFQKSLQVIKRISLSMKPLHQ